MRVLSAVLSQPAAAAALSPPSSSKLQPSSSPARSLALKSENIQKIMEGMTTKVNIDPEPPSLDESGFVDNLGLETESVDEIEPESKIIAKLVLRQQLTEVEELPIDNLVDLSEEPIMELVSSLTAISLRSHDIYDSLQISTGDKFTGDWCLGICVCFQWS